MDFNWMPDKASNPKNFEPKTTSQKAIKSVSQILGWISVAVITFVYAISGFFAIVATGASVQDILIKMAVTLLVGIMIARGWAKQGLLAGTKDDLYVSAKEDHKNAIVESQEYFEHAEEWEEFENVQSLREARKLILGEAALPYHKFFDDYGEFIGDFYPTNSSLSKEELDQNILRNKIIKSAIKHKITPVIVSNLTSLAGGDMRDRNKIGKTAAELDKASLLLETLFKVGTAVVFGLWTLDNVTSGSKLVQTLVELGLFQVGGALGYYSRYLFRTENEVSVYNKKTTLLQRLIRFGKMKKEVNVNGIKSEQFSKTERISVRANTFSDETTGSTELPNGLDVTPPTTPTTET